MGVLLQVGTLPVRLRISFTNLIALVVMVIFPGKGVPLSPLFLAGSPPVVMCLTVVFCPPFSRGDPSLSPSKALPPLFGSYWSSQMASLTAWISLLLF